MPASPSRKPCLSPPRRVAVLGCGSVGAGVVEKLNAARDRFAVTSVLVRDPAKEGRPPADYTDDLDVVFAKGFDILVEVMGGADAPADIMERAMTAGAHVVTANKAAIAKHYERLTRAAARARVSLAYSAAVGGGAPILETVAALRCDRTLIEVEGVMNGTANFLLDRIGEGMSFDAAVMLAQDKGFAEADPSADVDGHDAADKLSILMRECFEVARAPNEIPKDTLRGVTFEDIARARAQGLVYKQIGRARMTAGDCAAEVVVRPIPADHPFADARDEDNRFAVRCMDGGETRISGKGAGREPTASSVMGDIERIAAAVAPALAIP